MKTIRVLRHLGDRVAEITLNRPEAMNSISTELAGARSAPTRRKG